MQKPTLKQTQKTRKPKKGKPKAKKKQTKAQKAYFAQRAKIFSMSQWELDQFDS